MRTDKLIFLVISVVAVASLSSCAPRLPFTQNVREEHKLSPEELQSIQFFTSHDIVLQRGEKDDKAVQTTEGTLTVKSGKSLEQVVIPRGTPGVVEKVIDDNRIAVSFEEGEESFLVFGDPHDRKGAYKLLAAEWIKGKGGKLQYGGKTYYATPESSNVYLVFKMKSLHEYKKEARVVKGKTIN